MKLEIFDQPKKTERKIRLSLVPSESGDGSIGLVCVDEEGNTISDAKILFINPSGRLYLSKGMRRDFGFQLDMRGRIEITDDPVG